MAQVIGLVSASSENKIIDKGISQHKHNKNIKINWMATVYKDKKLEVYRYFYKNNTLYKTKKTTFQRINKSKLKVFTNEKLNKNTYKTYKYMNIKKGVSLKSHYFNKYQKKILKNVYTSKIFDAGCRHVSNVADGKIKWSTRIYYNKNKVSIDEELSSIESDYEKKIIIKRNSKDKLKITTKFTQNKEKYTSKTKKVIPKNNKLCPKCSKLSSKCSKPCPICSKFTSKNKKTIIETKKVSYVSSNLSPKNYYLNVYKPRMAKYFIAYKTKFIRYNPSSPENER